MADTPMSDPLLCDECGRPVESDSHRITAIFEDPTGTLPTQRTVFASLECAVNFMTKLFAQGTIMRRELAALDATTKERH
ncbi:MAG TPA: hypothetical protein VJP78_01545 [Thermoleophilia bacterium]|nr:hypothetical protein [Thermoleophilia bacterium]